MKSIKHKPVHIDEMREEDIRILTEESLKELTPLNCRLYIQDQGWENRQWPSRPMPVRGPIDLFWLMGQSDEIKNGLVELFTEFCKTLKETDEASKSVDEASSSRPKTRENEMMWMGNNKSLLAKLAGNWIVIEGDRLIASSNDFAVVLKESKVRGVEVPFILYVPEPLQDATIGI